MTKFRGISPLSPPGRFLLVAGIAFLACLLAFSGCTSPVIPSPLPATTPPPVVTTQAPPTARPTIVVTTPTQQAYLTYSNPQYAFSISYPVGWTKQENVGANAVVFTSPSTGSLSDIPATMKIAVILDNTLSLEQFKNAELAKRHALDNYNLIYDQAYKGTGFSGWKVAYTANQGVLTEWVEIYAIRGSTAYTVIFSSRQDRYANFVIQSDQMFKSFQVTG
ncbi:MAG TPA: hypothetical protein VKO45_07865 [Methanomicrobiales archaeon]|nr:hypothetical protein [Methanomicrobiales archaeon]